MQWKWYTVGLLWEFPTLSNYRAFLHKLESFVHYFDVFRNQGRFQPLDNHEYYENRRVLRQNMLVRTVHLSGSEWLLKVERRINGLVEIRDEPMALHHFLDVAV